MHEPVRTNEPADLPLTVSVDHVRSNLAVLRLDGDLDMLTAPVLHDQLMLLFDGPGRSLLLDLEGVVFLGSAGLAELAWAKDEAGKHGTRIGLVAGSRVVLRPLEVTGLATMFQIYDSVESALLDL